MKSHYIMGPRWIFTILLYSVIWFQEAESGNANQAECGNDPPVAGTVQEFTSPGYPHSYPNNLKCTWLFRANTAGGSKGVYLDVLSSAVENSTDCSMDSVTAYDGASVQSRLLLKWCGTLSPAVVSSGEFLTLTFVTNPSITLAGFRLQYSEVTVMQNCGGSLIAEATTKVLVSPGYPIQTPSIADCTWTISTRNDWRINATLIEWLMESCQNNQVSVYDGRDVLLGSFCGVSEASSYISYGSLMKIKYSTESSGVSRGFVIEYNGGAIEYVEHQNIFWSAKEQLLSPKGADQFQGFSFFSWTMTAHSEQKMCLSLSKQDNNCTHHCTNCINVFQGADNSQNLLGVYCGGTLKNLCSDTGKMYASLRVAAGQRCCFNITLYGVGQYNTPTTTKSPVKLENQSHDVVIAVTVSLGFLGLFVLAIACYFYYRHLQKTRTRANGASDISTTVYYHPSHGVVMVPSVPSTYRDTARNIPTVAVAPLQQQHKGGEDTTHGSHRSKNIGEIRTTWKQLDKTEPDDVYAKVVKRM